MGKPSEFHPIQSLRMVIWFVCVVLNSVGASVVHLALRILSWGAVIPVDLFGRFFCLSH